MNDNRNCPPKHPVPSLLRTKERSFAAPSTAAEEESFAAVAIRREAVRLANHRDGDRHLLENEMAEIVHKGQRQQVFLVNLSGGGAMIEGAAGPRLWDQLAICLGEDHRIQATVRWIRGNRLGLEFAQETRIQGSVEETARILRSVIGRSYPDVADEAAQNWGLSSPTAGSDAPAAPGAGKNPAEQEECNAIPRELRHTLIWSGLIHYDHDTTPVRLRNISAGGALIESRHALKVGGELLLELDKIGSIFASVNWVRGDTAGLRFHQPFDLQLLASARPRDAGQRWVTPDYLRESSAENPWAWQGKRKAGAAPSRRVRPIR